MKCVSNASWNNRWRTLSDVSVAELCAPHDEADLLVALQHAVAARSAIRATGGRWAFSAVGQTTGSSIDTRSFSGPLALPPTLSGQGWLRVRSGTGIATLHVALAGSGLQLPATGGSAGQSIAGALATGSHGAAPWTSPLVEHVGAIEVWLTPDQRFWVERPAQHLGTTGVLGSRNGQAGPDGLPVVVSEAIFQSAVVALGCCGVIASVTVQTVRRVAYRRVCYSANLADLPAIVSALGSPSSTTWRRPSASVGPLALYHVEVVVNPHSSEAFIVLLWEDPGATPPSPDVENARVNANAIGDLALWTAAPVRAVAQGDPGLAIHILGGQVSGRYPPDSGTDVRSFVSLFPEGALPDAASPTGMELAVAREDVVEAMRRVQEVLVAGGVAAPVGIRFSGGASAFLAPTRFAATATMEIGACNVPRSIAGFRSVVNALRAAPAIDFAQHPGLFTTFDANPPDLDRSVGAERLASWKAGRAALFALAPDAAALYSTPYSDKAGLTR